MKKKEIISAYNNMSVKPPKFVEGNTPYPKQFERVEVKGIFLKKLFFS